MAVTGACHLYAYLTKQEFPLLIYPVMFAFMLVLILIVVYVITPLMV